MAISSFIIFNTICILTGIVLDLLVGDPIGFIHIVIVIGRYISFLEKKLYKDTDDDKTMEFKGSVIAFIVPVTVMILAGIVLVISFKIHPAVYFVIESFLCWQAVAARDLAYESMRVYKALNGEKITIPDFENGGKIVLDAVNKSALEGEDAQNLLKKQKLENARRAVSLIVGRDTDSLDETGVIKAAVETVAENTSDGIIAPLFYMFLGGGALAVMYKAVNTLDSMLGYKNDKYMHFGSASAIQDDYWNYIPSRLSALLICLAAFFTKMDHKNAYRIWKRDRYKHESPNSAQTESACAGALNIQLAGDASYFGHIKHKDTIGDPVRPVERDDIKRACRLMYATSFLMMMIGLIIRILVYWIILI
jgi:adenosylcobinamide-phosphate synthase